jgi:glycerate dehydrogenase
MKGLKIVVLDGHTLNPGDLSWDKIEKSGQLTVYDKTPAEKVLERSLDADVIFTNKTLLTREVIYSLENLKFIGVLATGYNVVDTEAAKERGIIVSNVPGYSTSSVVQLTFALILELCHHVQRHSDSVIQGKWSKSPHFCYWDYPLTELDGKTIGIIGFGNIGKKVASVAGAFGMKIIANSRSASDKAINPEIKWASVNDLLRESDIVSIHCPLTNETKGLINIERLRQMKKSAILINTSRGPVVVEEDLAFALNNELIAGAGIDVLSIEPPKPDNPLLTAKNCLITPHIAWATLESRDRLMNISAENLNAFVAGNPINVVNR